jgi:radical SAM protein with 4Fe4S-binding SPASM domain
MDFATYRKKWAEAGEHTPEIPLNIDIEISSACNLKCPFCFLQNKSYKQPHAHFMPTDWAFYVLNNARQIGIPAVKLNWRGEATIHPDFSKIAKYAGYQGFHEVLLNTNGNYNPHINDVLWNCTKVMFSLDSCKAKTYQKMRKGGNLDKILYNINTLIKLRHDNIWVRRVITKDNKAENFAQDVKDIFGDNVKVAEHYCFDRANDAKGEGGRLYCGYPSQRLVVATDGTVYPCCVDYGQTMKVGDITKSALGQIWKGDNIENLRADLKKGKFKSSACKNCTSWMGYDNPKRGKVADIQI